MTDRAGRWVTEQLGRYARSVNELAVELGCDWHTINDTVIAYDIALVDDPDRIGPVEAVEAVGLDETLMVKRGPWKTQRWATPIVDVGPVDCSTSSMGATQPGRASGLQAVKTTGGTGSRGRRWTCQARIGR